MEIWKDIPSWEDKYQASNIGRIRSKDRLVRQHHNSTQLKKGKILSLSKDKIGYLCCALSVNNVLHSYKVHRLIALTFLGFPEKGYYEINHKDCNKTNNKIENLEWSNRSLNINHAIKKGLIKYNVGENHCNSKLNNNQRKEIVNYRNTGMTLKEIAKIYSVHLCTISRICNYDNNKLRTEI